MQNTTLVYLDDVNAKQSGDFIQRNLFSVKMHKDFVNAKRALCASVRDYNIRHHKDERDRKEKQVRDKRLNLMQRW